LSLPDKNLLELVLIFGTSRPGLGVLFLGLFFLTRRV